MPVASVNQICKEYILLYALTDRIIPLISTHINHQHFLCKKTLATQKSIPLLAQICQMEWKIQFIFLA
jgi:hypothetical protein